MPFGDRTGPLGLGPRTGRGLGYCSGYPYPGYMNPAYPRLGLGLGRGYGRGLGFGFGRGYGRGAGFGRGQGWRWAGYFPGTPFYPWSTPYWMNYPPYPYSSYSSTSKSTQSRTKPEPEE